MMQLGRKLQLLEPWCWMLNKGESKCRRSWEKPFAAPWKRRKMPGWNWKLWAAAWPATSLRQQERTWRPART